MTATKTNGEGGDRLWVRGWKWHLSDMLEGSAQIEDEGGAWVD